MNHSFSHRSDDPFALRDLWTRVRGVRIHSFESSVRAGIPIILLPGLSMSGRYFLRLARRLAEHHPVQILELPGFGRSAGARRVRSMAELAQWVEDWRQTRGIGSCHVVGHSMGCQVAAHFAGLAGADLMTLTLIAPTVDAQARRRATQIGRLIRDLTRERGAVLYWAVADVLRAGILRTWGTATEMLADPIEAQLARITIPTLLLRGKADSIAPESWLQSAAQALPVGCWETIPVGAHCVQFSAPEQTEEAILCWIRKSATESQSYGNPPLILG